VASLVQTRSLESLKLSWKSLVFQEGMDQLYRCAILSPKPYTTNISEGSFQGNSQVGAEVASLVRTGPLESLKLSWKNVANTEHGGSYHFGNSTCKKKWAERSR
jgi:predicted RNA-binding protein with EMAP domain